MTSEPTPSLQTVLDRYGGQVSFLVSILQDLQRQHGYLPVPHLKEVSRQLQVPFSQVYSVATFYKSLSLKPRGRHLISVCTGTVCHLKGAGQLVEAIRDRLRLSASNTTDDMRFTLETVNCLGACALAPILVVDGTYYAKAKPGQVTGILKSYR